MKTVTFNNGEYQFTVKDDYFDTINLTDVEKETTFNILTKSNIVKYLHNETGPAVVDLKNGNKQYFIDGKLADQDMMERIEHGMKFNAEFKEILEDNVD